MNAPSRPLVVAMVGRPNTGKTSLVMHLTGLAQRPVNFPGSSVERSVSAGRFGDEPVEVVDLPGVSSLEALTRDEVITVDYLRGEGATSPDVLC
ncbi:MAG: FeoB small GTPase domain-containing protein, partial [Myxococcota bacterium]|nr:FeoB small GTPase domain-containing protein [Myxococcota bacterium]